MSLFLNISSFNKDLLEKANIPVIFCSFSMRANNIIKKTKYIPLNINVLLAEALLQYPQEDRKNRINDEIIKIANQLQSPVFIEDYEILFNPEYNIDVIKILIEISKRQKVAVKWCGTLNGDLLEYATPEYPDYHSYNIRNYDIICVV